MQDILKLDNTSTSDYHKNYKHPKINTMQKTRVTLDSVALAHRARGNHAHARDISAPRVQRQVIRRATVPKHRQPRVRLGRPTGPTSYVHWQDYLDIADLHKMPETPAVSKAMAEQYEHHETVTEMFNRYRHVAENLNDKINHMLEDLKPRSAQVVPIEEVEALED